MSKIKNIKIIENPSSGRQNSHEAIDYLCTRLLNSGYTLNKFYTKNKNDAREETIRACNDDWDLILACGGDGTVNEVAAGIAESKNKVPVGIISTGTVNDFANHMDLPEDMDEYFEMIERRKIKEIDLGIVNNEYFVNVAASGLLTDVGYKVAPEAKAVFGRMAYYVEGLRELPRQKIDPIKMKFESEEYSEETEVLLFVVSNSASIGGFKKLAPDASVSDGYLDVMIIKKSDISDLAQIFFNIFRGEHIHHPNVTYFKTQKLRVEADQDLTIDIDGEYGGRLPGEFKVVHKGMKILIP